MSDECVKKPKLLCEERRVRHNASKRAWAAKNYEQRRAYQLLYARRQREALLIAGFVPNPVGRPKKDPEVIGRTCAAHRERGSDYKEYQKLYHRQFRARRRAEGWVVTPCGLVSPRQIEALKKHRSFIRPEKSAPPVVNTTTNHGESNS